MIRRARLEDIGAVSEIYELIHSEEEQGRACIGWSRGVYPTRDTAQSAFERGELFVCERDGVIAASAVINRSQHEAYSGGNWKFACDAERVLVMHTLTVSPKFARRGIGGEFVSFYADYAKECGCPELRIDTQEKNTRARAMYKKLGFCEVGTVSCEFNGIKDIRLVLLEKQLRTGDGEQ